MNRYHSVFEHGLMFKISFMIVIHATVETLMYTVNGCGVAAGVDNECGHSADHNLLSNKYLQYQARKLHHFTLNTRSLAEQKRMNCFFQCHLLYTFNIWINKMNNIAYKIITIQTQINIWHII